jgi:hypothetical protein
MHLSIRKKLLEIACYGSHNGYLQTQLNTDLLFTSLSDHQTNRIKSALTSEFSVFPITESIYTIKSYSEDTVATYQVHSGIPSCTCKDFLYRCDYENGEKCKHIWRVLFLIKMDVLPDNDEDPSRWLFFELEKDRLILQSKGQTDLAIEIEELQTHISNTKLANISINRIFIQWLQIVTEACK